MIDPVSLLKLLAPVYLDKNDKPCEKEDSVATQYGNLRQCALGGPPKKLVDGKWVLF